MQEKVLDLVEKVEAIAPEVWEIYLRQQYIEAGLYLVAFGALVWVWNRVGVDFLKSYAEYCEKSVLDQEFGALTSGAIISLALVISTAVIGFGALEAIGHILNPEYYAIQEMMP